MSMRSERAATVPFLYTLVGGARVDICKMRRSAVCAIAFFGAASLVWHDPSVASIEAALVGGFVATFLYDPLQRFRLPSPSPVGNGLRIVAALTSIASLFFIIGKSTEPVDLLYRFFAGAVLYGSVIVADRLRAPRESV